MGRDKTAIGGHAKRLEIEAILTLVSQRELTYEKARLRIIEDLNVEFTERTLRYYKNTYMHSPTKIKQILKQSNKLLDIMKRQTGLILVQETRVEKQLLFEKPYGMLVKSTRDEIKLLNDLYKDHQDMKFSFGIDEKAADKIDAKMSGPMFQALELVQKLEAEEDNESNERKVDKVLPES